VFFENPQEWVSSNKVDIGVCSQRQGLLVFDSSKFAGLFRMASCTCRRIPCALFDWMCRTSSTGLPVVLLDVMLFSQMNQRLADKRHADEVSIFYERGSARG